MNSNLFTSLLAKAALFLGLASTSVLAQNGYYAAGHYSAAQAQAAYQAQQQAAYAQNQAAWAAYYQQQQANAQAWAAYHAQQAAAVAAARAPRTAAPAPAPRAVAYSAPRASAPAAATGGAIRFDGRFASVGSNVPAAVQHVVYAANKIQNKPYVRGGGHARVEDSAYDCSGSVSYTLIKAGLLRAPLSSGAFASYGEAGEGRFITIWVKPGEHVFMTVCGLRMDTSGSITGEGPRWRTKSRSYAGFSPRHPAGL